MKRSRIVDIAREAGVSKATVDRVIHSRGAVRADTALKVAEAAHRVDYYGSNLIDQQLAIKLPRIRFGFLLTKGKQEFYQSFSRELEFAVGTRDDVRGSTVVRFSPSQSPADVAEAMLALGEQTDVIACTAVNHHAVGEATLELRQKGKPTFALLTDFAQGTREHYIGLDNLKAGRIAAWMISLAAQTPGKIALFLGSNRWQGHELRETGFRSNLREADRDLTLLESVINLETRQLTYETTLALLERHDDLAGICVAGGGMEGAISALREARAPGEVALVVNELTSISRKALSDRYATMVISTPLAELCRETVELMVRAVRNGPAQAPGRRFLEPQIFLPPSV
ncbi:LacI family DNA-binding transcriptional regulator [Allomesorhizobium alhagi]|uniref:LacI family DNA-binding transcriptional regulator n=1 Tax=Allomesorhizobium alhagi TaxID=475067 RepID=UPI00058B3AB2|nr:LacI family DNA-binding transcriptional regulator [Mesorhizobium alhagi]